MSKEQEMTAPCGECHRLFMFRPRNLTDAQYTAVAAAEQEEEVTLAQSILISNLSNTENYKAVGPHCK